MLDHSAQNKYQIHDLAQSIVDHADKEQRAYEESDVAYRLAEALLNIPSNRFDSAALAVLKIVPAANQCGTSESDAPSSSTSAG